MGEIIDFPRLHILLDFYNEIESSIRNNAELDIKDVVNKLSLFCLSDNFCPFLLLELKNIWAMSDIVIIYEMKEKFLSLKIIFPLVEELKNTTFDKNVIEIIKQLENKKISENIISSYIDNNKNSIEKLKMSEKGKKIINEINSYFSRNTEEIGFLRKLYCGILGFTFIDIAKHIIKTISNNNKKEDLLIHEYVKFAYDDYHKYLKDNNNNLEELNYLIDYLNNLNLLNHTKEAQQIILFIFNLIKNEKEISIREEINDNFFKKYGNLNNIKEKIIWTLYEKDFSISNPSISVKKYRQIILEGKKEKEKLNFDIFENINEIKRNKEVKGLNAFTFKSLFTDKKIIIIKLDLNYYKNKKISLEQFKEEINLILKFCSLEFISSEPNKYIQIENKIISLDNSYNLFIKELTDRKIIYQSKVQEEKIKSLEEPKKCLIKNENNDIKIEKGKSANDKEIEELNLELNKERTVNKELNEKIKQLEKELNEEKNKNKTLEAKILNLRKDFDDENNKFLKFKEEIEKEKLIKKKLEKESKESFLETIIEKEKEIKELKLKLSRYPFVLEEGEKLMSIIFNSVDQKVNFSVICKNTDEFHKIEAQLYKNYSEYSENDNFFTVKGIKVNRYKTLENNNIKNNDVIILNMIE